MKKIWRFNLASKLMDASILPVQNISHFQYSITQVAAFFFLSALLRDCSLCWDRWNGTWHLHLTRPCFISSRAGTWIATKCFHFWAIDIPYPSGIRSTIQRYWMTNWRLYKPSHHDWKGTGLVKTLKYKTRIRITNEKLWGSLKWIKSWIFQPRMTRRPKKRLIYRHATPLGTKKTDLRGYGCK